MEEKDFKSDIDLGQDQTSRLRFIADLYGTLSQQIQLIQEQAELTTALTKTMLCIDTPELKERVSEEIADVEILLEQVTYLLGCQDAVKKIKGLKIQRQMRKIEEAGIKLL